MSTIVIVLCAILLISTANAGILDEKYDGAKVQASENIKKAYILVHENYIIIRNREDSNINKSISFVGRTWNILSNIQYKLAEEIKKYSKIDPNIYKGFKNCKNYVHEIFDIAENSMFKMTVTDSILKNIMYVNDGYATIKKNIDKLYEKYNNCDNGTDALSRIKGTNCYFQIATKANYYISASNLLMTPPRSAEIIEMTHDEENERARYAKLLEQNFNRFGPCLRKATGPFPS